MSNKDLKNPVLEGKVSDATKNLRTNTEPTIPTDTTIFSQVLIYNQHLQQQLPPPQQQ